MNLSKQQFLDSKHKVITIIGMSGVGKTTLCHKLSRKNWFHYSGDYRIGTRYLSEPIMDNIKAKAMKVPFLRDLLLSDSIYLANNTSFHNLAPVTTFLGKLGDRNSGGMQIDKFKARQDLHRQAEIRAMLDVPAFIKKSLKIYNYPHFVNDVGGSICEVATEEVLQTLAKHSIILYLKANQEIEQEIIQRAITHPKPMYFRPDFLDEYYSIYKKQHSSIIPDEFSRWIFPHLIEHRKPLYQKIADDYGYTLDAGNIENIKDESELIEWISEVL